MTKQEHLKHQREITHNLYKDKRNKDMEKKWEEYLKRNRYSIKKLKAIFYEFEEGNFIVDILHIDYSYYTSNFYEGNDYLYDFGLENNLVNWLDDDYTLQTKERMKERYNE